MFSSLLLSMLVCGSPIPPGGEVRYSVRPQPGVDRTRLAVTIEMLGDADGTTHIRLPRGRFGTPDLARSVRDLQAQNARIETVESDAASRELVHEPNAAVTLSYVVDWDPAAHTGSAYCPSVGPGHFHFFGSQWRIALPDGERSRTWVLEFADVPEGWTVFSNLGPGTGPYEVVGRDGDLSGLIGGGDYSARHFECGGTAVSVYARGPFAETDRVLDDVQASIELFTDAFGSTGMGHYTVAVTGRGNFRAGVAIDGAFVCLVDPQTSPADLLRLIAHEALHNWVTKRAKIAQWADGGDHGIDEYRFDWFSEGFVEYCTRRALLHAGLFSDDEFVEAFNRDLAELARNPQRKATLEDVGQALRTGNYTNRHERLNYCRGPLLALRWDRGLRRTGATTVFEVFGEFIDRAGERGGALDEEEFFDLLEGRGIDARADYRRFIVAGEAMIPERDVFGPDFAPEDARFESFDAGFDVEASRAAGIVVGVLPEGPAQRAGLRAGVELVRFESNGDADLPAKVTIREGGRETTLEYRPVSPADTLRFVRRSAMQEALGSMDSSSVAREWYLPTEDGSARLYVWEIGQGEPVIVVHGGFGAEHSYLYDAVRGLTDRFQFVFYDQRGSLRSPCAAENISFEKHVADLDLLRRELRLERVHLFAHSMGTVIAMQYLADSAENVGNVVLAAALAADRSFLPDQARQDELRAFMERPAIEQELERVRSGGSEGARLESMLWRVRFAGSNVYHVERWRRMKGGQAFYSQTAGSAAGATLPAWDFTEALRAQASKVTVVNGDHDFVDFGADSWRALGDSLDGLEVQVLERAGHNSWIDQPQPFRAALAGGLTRSD